MRVVHQVNSLSIGGVETFVYRLCKYAKEDVMVLSHGDGSIGWWLADLRVPTCISNDYEIIKSTLKLFGPDVFVMHTGSYLPEYINQLKEDFPRLKLIAVLHTPYPAEYSDSIDKIVCVSSSIYNMNDPAKSVLIYPGIDRKEKFVIGDVTILAKYKYIEDLIE